MALPNFAITVADPLGIGSLDGSTAVNTVSVSGGPQKQYHEVLGGNGLYILSAVKILKPIENWDMEYELLDGGDLEVGFGDATNGDYLITAFSASCSPDARPTASITAIKPSASAKIKPYSEVGTPPTLTITGGFGIVEKWGATSTSAFVSSQGSVSMQTAEALDETSGDFLANGLLTWGFKQECQVEAYGPITVPEGKFTTDNPVRRQRDGYETHSASFWSYLDANVAV